MQKVSEFMNFTSLNSFRSSPNHTLY